LRIPPFRTCRASKSLHALRLPWVHIWRSPSFLKPDQPRRSRAIPCRRPCAPDGGAPNDSGARRHSPLRPPVGSEISEESTSVSNGLFRKCLGSTGRHPVSSGAVPQGDRQPTALRMPTLTREFPGGSRSAAAGGPIGMPDALSVVSVGHAPAHRHLTRPPGIRSVDNCWRDPR
jgi:hypothetical protein